MKRLGLTKLGLAALTIAGLAACSTPPTQSTTSLETDMNTTALSKPAQDTKYNEAQEVRGMVQQYLMNPRGQVDGIILNDGTQVAIPPHISPQVTRAIKTNDEVIVRGFYENDKVFKAEEIRNATTNKRVVNLLSPPPPANKDEFAAPVNDLKASVAAPSARTLARERRGLKQLSAEGTVQTKIYGPAGEVSGVVLSDGSIVRFAPDVVDQTTASPEIGDSIRVTGYGTRNKMGQAIEATSVRNRY